MYFSLTKERLRSCVEIILSPFALHLLPLSLTVCLSSFFLANLHPQATVDNLEVQVADLHSAAERAARAAAEVGFFSSYN